MPPNALPKSTGRHAVAVIEVLAAIAVLSIVLLLAAKMTTSLNQHRKSVERHRITMDAKTNLMNFAMAMPYESITETALTEQAEQLFANAEWLIEVTEADGVAVDTGLESELPVKKIVVDLVVGEEAQRIKLRQPLVLWRYPIGGEQ